MWVSLKTYEYCLERMLHEFKSWTKLCSLGFIKIEMPGARSSPEASHAALNLRLHEAGSLLISFDRLFFTTERQLHKLFKSYMAFFEGGGGQSENVARNLFFF